MAHRARLWPTLTFHQFTVSQVTTIIPAFNGERFLAATLESLAAQKRQPDRVVLLDDGSTDRTAELARAFVPLRVEVVPNERNLGLFGNHNRALTYAAETDYLHILHADDLIAPEFFSRLLALLESTPPGAFAYCEHRFIDEFGRPLKLADYPLPHGTGPVSRNDFLVSQTELKAIQLHSVLLKTGRRPAPVVFRLDLRQVADVVFHAELAAHSAAIFRTSEILALVRLHGANASYANAARLQSWVLDEFTAMNIAADLLDEPASHRWLRRHRLRCLWAARAAVKRQMVRSANPAFAIEIDRAVRERAGPLHWLLGNFAVALRDFHRQRSRR
jgi:glycosyltransferase involved in cell wall biosynthesis